MSHEDFKWKLNNAKERIHRAKEFIYAKCPDSCSSIAAKYKIRLEADYKDFLHFHDEVTLLNTTAGADEFIHSQHMESLIETEDIIYELRERIEFEEVLFHTKILPADSLLESVKYRTEFKLPSLPITQSSEYDWTSANNAFVCEAIVILFTPEIITNSTKNNQLAVNSHHVKIQSIISSKKISSGTSDSISSHSVHQTDSGQMMSADEDTTNESDQGVTVHQNPVLAKDCKTVPVQSIVDEKDHSLPHNVYREKQCLSLSRSSGKVRFFPQLTDKESVLNGCLNEKFHSFSHQSNRTLLDISSVCTPLQIFNLYQESKMMTLGFIWKLINIFFLLQVVISPVSVRTNCTNLTNISVGWLSLFITRATIYSALESSITQLISFHLVVEDNGLLLAGASSNYLHDTLEDDYNLHRNNW